MILQTERLRLERLRPEDATRLLEYRADCPYQSWEPSTLEDARDFIARASVATPGGWRQVGLRLRDSDRLVGDLGVCVQDRQAEFGITLAPEFQGRGLAQEALRALLAHLFGTLGLHRVHASVDPRNHPSVALLERLGMRREAWFRESLWFRGAWADDLVYALLAAEWRLTGSG